MKTIVFYYKLSHEKDSFVKDNESILTSMKVLYVKMDAGNPRVEVLP